MKACVVIRRDASKQGNVQKEDLVNLTPTPGNKVEIEYFVHYNILYVVCSFVHTQTEI